MSPEFLSRAQVIHREQRDLYDYWQACAQPGRIPSRFDIDPVVIPHLMPSLSLLDVFDDLDLLQYRLAGTRVREIYSAEITGRRVFESGFQYKAEYWRSAYSQVVDNKLAMQGIIRGPVAGRDHLVLFWLRLPLEGLSGRVEHVLGHDAGIAAGGDDRREEPVRLQFLRRVGG
jgi:hypothetical protein